MASNQKHSDGKIVNCCRECSLFVPLRGGICYSAACEIPRAIDQEVIDRGFPGWCPLSDEPKGE